MTRKVWMIVALLTTCGIAGYGQHTELDVDYVRTDLIGPHDKPLSSMIITTVNVKFPFPSEQNILVSQKVFDEVLAFIVKHPEALTNREGNEFGQFRITRQINKTKTFYYLSTRNASIRFFQDLRAMLAGQRGVDALTREINHALNYIGVKE